MINFEKLFLRNFLSYGPKAQVVRLADQGIVRLQGNNLDDPGADSNMAGKSAILDALVWCLFGKTIRGVSHNAVVHNRLNRNCKVSVVFRVGSVPYKITRYRMDSAHRNGLYLYRSGALLSYRHESETQIEIERILNCNYSTFVNSVVFGGAKPFASLPDSEQKKVLESFLNFDQIDKALKRTKKRLDRVRDRLNGLDLEIEKQNGKVQIQKERFYGEKKRREEYKAELKEALAQKETNRSINLSSYQQHFLKSQKRSNLRYDRFLRAESRKDHYAENLLRLTKAIRENAGLIGTNCPTCKQLITKKTLASYLEGLQSERRGVRSDLESATRRATKLRKAVLRDRQKTERLQAKYNQMQEKFLLAKQAEERIFQLARKLEEIISSSDYLEVYSKSVARLLKLCKKRERLARLAKGLEFWKVGFGNKGIKALIVREALPALNDKLQEYSSRIFGEPIDLEFLPAKTTKSGEERDLFHVSYKARHGASSYVGESAGGRRRIDICILLCFSWFSRISNVLLVDELLDGLDKTGREAALDILSKLRGTVLVISHRRDISSRVGKTWTVTKKKGQSTLET